MERRHGALLSVAILFLSYNAQASYVSDFLKPYVGIDVQMRHTPYETGFGDNVFAKDLIQGNAYLGIRPYKHLGLEVGYKQTPNYKKNVTVMPGQLFLGRSPDAPPTNYMSHVEMKGWNINFTGFLPVSDAHRFELIAQAGVTRLKTIHQTYTIFDRLGVMPVADTRREFVGTKWILQGAVGVQHMLYECNQCGGIRMTVGWENTSRLRNMVSKTDMSGTIKIRDSLIGSVGVLVNF